MGLKHIPFSTEESNRCRQRLSYCSKASKYEARTCIPLSACFPHTPASVCFYLLSKSPAQPYIGPGTQDLVRRGRKVIHSINVNYYSDFYPHFSAENLSFLFSCIRKLPSESYFCLLKFFLRLLRSIKDATVL